MPEPEELPWVLNWRKGLMVLRGLFQELYLFGDLKKVDVLHWLDNTLFKGSPENSLFKYM